MSQSAKKTKILFIITQGEMGGAQRYVLDLATHLDKNRYEILVAVGEARPPSLRSGVSGQEKSDLTERLRAAIIPVTTIPHLVRDINIFYELLAITEIEKLIKQYQPDIVHLNSSKAGVLGSIAAGLAKNPNVIFTAHGFAFLEPHGFRSVYLWAEKFATRFRKKIISVSDYDRAAAVKAKLCSEGKIVTVHNGIETQDAVRAKRSKLRKIGTIAHDYPTKDLGTLRSAFNILKKNFPDLALSIIGRGGTNGEVRDASKMLSDFDIYVCSSVKEGFPYSILEAMRAGLPIVSTAVGGIPEMIGNTGVLVPPKNPDVLAAAIKKLIGDPDLADELGRAAQKKVQEFSLDKMVSETEKVYEAVLK